MAQVWREIKIALMMAVVVIANQLLMSDKLLAQPGNPYSFTLAQLQKERREM